MKKGPRPAAGVQINRLFPVHFSRSSLINSKQNKVEIFFSPFILMWLQTESAIPRIISHSAPALKSSSDPNKTYQKPGVTPTMAGWEELAGSDVCWSLWSLLQLGLIAIPHDIPPTRETVSYGGISQLATHSPITFGIQYSLSPRALLAQTSSQPNKLRIFPKIFTAHTKRFGKIVNEDQDSLWLARVADREDRVWGM